MEALEAAFGLVLIHKGTTVHGGLLGINKNLRNYAFDKDSEDQGMIPFPKKKGGRDVDF